jgi:predicted AlkP superfamily phosphohydrolase/phosphomutase
MTSRLVCIAFDSPDLDMLQRGIDEGWMPALADVVERGRFVAIEDHQEILTSPSWPTFVHGCDPTDHMLFRDAQLGSGTYRIEDVDLERTERPPFWTHVSDAGLRSTIVSVYGGQPLPGLRGTQIVGWGSHDPFSKDIGQWCNPPGLIRSIEREVGKREIRHGFRIPRTTGEFREMGERCIRGTEQQSRALLRLLDETDWDLFFGSFADCHDAGHYLRRFADPNDPDCPPDVDDDLRDALPAIYRKVDAGIGQIVDRLPSDACLMLVTPYTMTRYAHAVAVVEPVLERAGLLARVTGVPAGGARASALAAARRGVHALVPARLRPALGRLVPRDRWVKDLVYADVDWQRTSAFALLSDGSSAIRLNVAGREPSGTVSPGEHYDRVCDEIKAIFGELVASDDGQPIAEEIVRFDELFDAPPGGPFPDILIRWRERYRLPSVRSERVGEVEVLSEDMRTANHKTPGFIIGLGPGIEASGSTRLEGPPARLVDFAATALARLGIEQPPTLTGRPLEALGAGVSASRR